VLGDLDDSDLVGTVCGDVALNVVVRHGLAALPLPHLPLRSVQGHSIRRHHSREIPRTGTTALHLQAVARESSSPGQEQVAERRSCSRASMSTSVR
jgi:hypothetical protein